MASNQKGLFPFRLYCEFCGLVYFRLRALILLLHTFSVVFFSDAVNAVAYYLNKGKLRTCCMT